jgi:TRAP-type uncharacterized transport system fused permease subunit
MERSRLQIQMLLERLFAVLRDGIHFLVPIAVLIGLLVAGFSPSYAAGGGILAVIAASWLTRRHRMRIGQILDDLLERVTDDPALNDPTTLRDVVRTEWLDE